MTSSTMQATRRWLGPHKALMLSCAAVLALSGFVTNAEAKDSITISLVQAMTGNEWATEVQAGADAAVKDLGGSGKVKLRVTGPPGIDPPKQTQMFLSELDTAPDAVVVVTIAPPLLTQPAQEADSKGIKVVWINVPPTPDVKNALLISADQYDMGKRGGKIVADALSKK